MGVYVNLNVQFDEIEPEQWEAAYVASLQLLQAFPGPLARMMAEKVRGFSRWTYTTGLVFDPETPKERWEVDGDLASRRFGETFCFYRHSSYYTSQGRLSGGGEPGVQRDILWAPKDKAHYPVAAGLDVFGSKTQGYPYHLAMLAVGVLIENWFPQRAVVTGDINRSQAEPVVRWAESVLGRSFQLPVICHPSRLWQRLSAAFPGELDLAIERYQTLMHGDGARAWRVLLAHREHELAVRRSFQNDLDRYKSLGPLGATRLIVDLCNAEKQVGRAIDWVCGRRLDGKPSKFPPEELLSILCDSFVTIPLDERNTLNAFNMPESPNIDDTFMHLLMTMAGKPTTLEFRLDEAELLAEFTSRWPERESTFRDLIHRRTEKCRQLVRASQQMLERHVAADSRGTDNPTARTGGDARAEQGDDPSEFIHLEIRRQRWDPHGAEQAARQLGQRLRIGFDEVPELRQTVAGFDRQRLTDKLYAVSGQHAIVLTQRAWRAIEQDATLEQLRCLTVLALIPEREITFCKWRRHLLESPDLWPVFVQEALPSGSNDRPGG
jgi:hypothetical protein